jgi:hypothetical protein
MRLVSWLVLMGGWKEFSESVLGMSQNFIVVMGLLLCYTPPQDKTPCHTLDKLFLPISCVGWCAIILHHFNRAMSTDLQPFDMALLWKYIELAYHLHVCKLVNNLVGTRGHATLHWYDTGCYHNPLQLETYKDIFCQHYLKMFPSFCTYWL